MPPAEDESLFSGTSVVALANLAAHEDDLVPHARASKHGHDLERDPEDEEATSDTVAGSQVIPPAGC